MRLILNTLSVLLPLAFIAGLSIGRFQNLQEPIDHFARRNFPAIIVGIGASGVVSVAASRCDRGKSNA